MAQRVRTDATIDAGDRRGTGHRVPDASGRERLVGTPAVFLAWKGTSAMEDHAPAVDVRNLQLERGKRRTISSRRRC